MTKKAQHDKTTTLGAKRTSVITHDIWVGATPNHRLSMVGAKMFHVKHLQSDFLLLPAFSVLVALIVGWTIQQNRPFSAQPIGFSGFYFVLSFFALHFDFFATLRPFLRGFGQFLACAALLN